MWRLSLCCVASFMLVGCGSNGLPSGPDRVTAQGDAAFETAEDISESPVEHATAPEAALARIALGSRANADLSPSVWNAVSATYPDLSIFAADVVCRDVEMSAGQANIGDLIALHDAYSNFANLDGFMQLREAAPVLAVRYDDRFDGEGRPADEGFNRISNQIHLDFWQASESDPRRSRTGLYFSQGYGPADRRVQVIVLDVMSVRGQTLGSNVSDPGSTPSNRSPLLGEAQWAWLEAELQKPAELRLIVSSTEVLSESRKADGWARFPEERARLLQLAVGAQGRTMLLSGNQRHGVIYRYQTGSYFPLYELSPSSLIKAGKQRREVGSHLLFRPLMIPNFGIVGINWQEREFFMEITDDTGATFRSMRVPLAIPLTS